MSGHGWVVPNPNGMRARCGGPGICGACALEKAQAEAASRETDLRGASVWFAGAYFMVRDGEIEASPVSDSPRVTYTPARFRERLALLGRLADEADPGARKSILLERLTRIAARTALRWMRGREAQS